MKTLTLATWVSVIGLFPLVVQGQIENYPLRDYKLPLIKRTSLDLNFSTYSNGLTGNVNYDSNQKTTANQFNFSGQGDASWQYYFQSPKWQTVSNASASINGSAYNSKMVQSSTNKSNYSNMQTSMDLSSYSLFYFNNKLFASISPQGSVDYGRSKMTTSIDSLSTTYNDAQYANNYSTQTSLGIGIGYGRIEPVWDAHKMIFTLLDIKKTGRLLREPTNEEITKISQTLSSLKNERYFDDREHTIREVTILDSLLTTMGITKTGDIGVSTAIYDNLCYAYMPLRYAGYRIWLEPKIGYSSTSSKITSMDKYNSHQMLLGVNINFTYEKPINIYWQRTIGLNASYTDNNIDSKNTSPANKNRISEIQLSGGYGYYPNTRTHFDLSAGGRFRNLDSDQTINNQPYRLKYGEIFAKGNLYYYFSPKIRINASAQVSYKTNINANSNLYFSQLPINNGLYDNFTTKEFSYTFLAALSYALF